jgi:hypothetical protein
MKVFLGGTCNGSKWRDEFIPKLKLDYFNPVVKEWNDAAYKRELRERKDADFVLYVVTPKMTGVYSIAEAVDDSNKRPAKTILCCLQEDGGKQFDAAQAESLKAVAKMVKGNGGHVCDDLGEAAKYLNGKPRTWDEAISAKGGAT